MGDLRVRCAGRAHQVVVRFETAKHLVRFDNMAREDFEPKWY